MTERNEANIIGHWKKDDLCYKCQTTWLNCVLLGVESIIVTDEFGYLAEESSK